MKRNHRGETLITAWVNADDVMVFKRRYTKQGAITDLIRRAFKIAIAETDKTEEAARHAVAQNLPEVGRESVSGPEDQR